MEKKEGKKKELKVTRGFSLSRENVMALQSEAFDRTVETQDGSTVSPSAVLDEIVTDWRRTRETSKMAKAMKGKKP